MTRVSRTRAVWAAAAERRGLSFRPGRRQCVGEITGRLAGGDLRLVGEGYGLQLLGLGPAYDVETTLTLTLRPELDLDDLDPAVVAALAPTTLQGRDLVRTREGWLATEAEVDAWLDAAARAAHLVGAVCGYDVRPTAADLAAAIADELRRTGRWTEPDRLPTYRGGPFGQRDMAFEQWLQGVLLVRLADIAAGTLRPPGTSELAAYAAREWDGQPVGLLPALLSAADDLSDLGD